MTTGFYSILLLYTLSVKELLIISFNKNFIICQIILDISDKRHKIEVNGSGRDINDNPKVALIEEYTKWVKDKFLSAREQDEGRRSLKKAS